MWSIVDVARMSGVSSRTLRHYAAKGLLPPAATDASGRRFYSRAQLVTLQQILLLRELGLGLGAIAAILAGEHDQREALRRHRRWLLAEADRFRNLAETVATTLADLEGAPVTTRDRLEQWFTSIARDSDREQQLRCEAEQRWGGTAATAHARTDSWTPQQQDNDAEAGIDVHARIAELAAAGVPADDARTLDAVAGHHAWLREHWEPSAAAYAELGRMYADPDDRFRAGYERAQPGLADYLRDAMTAYATHRM